MNKQIAHFFWHGDISIYEYACIGSFVKNNFEVNVWSYKPLKLPKGAVNKCAEEILPQTKLLDFEMPKGNMGSLAAFSDMFRLHVIKEKGGWWFDTDCICLAPQDKFLNLSKTNDIVAGWEDENTINNAVIFMSQELVNICIEKLNLLCLKNKNSFRWGECGPQLLTEFIKENNLTSKILPIHSFYPVYFKHAIDALDPLKLLEINALTKESLIYHYWSEIFKRKQINKSELPPAGSFLFNHVYPFYNEFINA
jgi:hypothetical protein